MSNLTADQREALKTVDALLWKHASEPGIQRTGQILYDLRTNAKPAWEITEERKETLLILTRQLHEVLFGPEIVVLRAMLEEAE